MLAPPPIYAVASGTSRLVARDAPALLQQKVTIVILSACYSSQTFTPSNKSSTSLSVIPLPLASDLQRIQVSTHPPRSTALSCIYTSSIHHVGRLLAWGEDPEQSSQVHRHLLLRDHLRMSRSSAEGYAASPSTAGLANDTLDLEWKLTYVGSATSSEHDQELDSLLVGPVPMGINKFVFEADPPNLSRLPSSELLGVTVILLTCSYDGREFVRVGYYVNNEYDNEEMQNEPPAKPVVERIKRNILAEKPRVTRFAIKW